MARCSADAQRAAGSSELGPARGYPFRGANPRDGWSRWCQYKGPWSAKGGASRRAPTRLPSTTRGHELQHPQSGHRRRARDRGDRRGAHLHEQRADRREGGSSTRQGLRRPRGRAGRHACEGHPCTRRPDSEGSRPGRPAPRRADHDRRHRRHRPQAGSLHRPAGLERRVRRSRARPPPRSRSAAPCAPSASTSRPPTASSARSRTATTSTSTPASAPATSASSRRC